MSQGQDVVSGLAATLGNGTLSQSGFTAAVNRISALRAGLDYSHLARERHVIAVRVAEPATHLRPERDSNARPTA